MFDQTVNTTQASRAGKTLELAENFKGPGFPTLDLNRKHTAIASHLSLRNGVLGVLGQPGIMDLVNSGMILQKLGDDFGIATVASQSIGKRLDPPEQ